MKRILLIATFAALISCTMKNVNLEAIPEASNEITRVEPLSWWVGMKTDLELMIQGKNISEWSVNIEGPSKGIKIKEVVPGDNPDFIFVNVKIAPAAKEGTYYIVFSKGEDSFKYPYQIGKKSTEARTSFTTADLIYLIMPDRFANGNPDNDNSLYTTELADRAELYGRHGGDIQGIIDHLDYIADLGVTAIWCTPMFLDDAPKESYHGYAISDYYHIDPRYGSNELYKDYVDAAHAKGLKIIMDVVTNHCGLEHWWMSDRPFNDWIHTFDEYTQTNVAFSTNMDPNASKYDLNIQESGWFVPSMPDMNLDNPHVLKYFQQWAIWWIEYAGLDGLRVDTYPYNEKEPMAAWCKAVLNEYPWINIVGECWTSSIPQLAYWQGGNANKDGFNSNLPSIMDFPLQEAICAGVPTDSLKWGEGLTKVYECLSHDFVYHDLSKMMIFPGNHDTERIGDVLKASPERLKIVMAMMATMRGIPQIFAGDEMMFLSADLTQGHGGLRVDFPGGWEGDKTNLFTAEGRAEAVGMKGYKHPVPGLYEDLFNYCSTLFNWRKTASAVHNGKTLHFITRDNTYGYFRYDEASVVFVYINNSRSWKNIPWSTYAEIAAELGEGRDVITGEAVTVSDETKVAPRTVTIVEYKR